MNDQHPFEILRRWSECSEDDLMNEIKGSSARITLSAAIKLLIDKPVEIDEYAIDEYPKIIKKLNQLVRDGSWSLGEAIIKSTDLAMAGFLENAIVEMEKFKVSCKSPFYRHSADKHILGLKSKF